MKIDKKDVECLRAALAEDGRGAWKPWRGVYGRAHQLSTNGFLLVAGMSAMPPHIVYVITDKGKLALSQFQRSEGK